MAEYTAILRSTAEAAQAIAYLRALDYSRPMVVTVKAWRRRRSMPQNRLMWMWMQVLADWCGHTAEEMHEYCKVKFLGTRELSIGADVSRYVTRSTSALDTKQMTDYLEAIRLWAAEKLQCTLPQPDSIGWDDLCERYDTSARD